MAEAMFEPLTDAERAAATAPSGARSEEWTFVSPIPSDAPKEFPTHSLGQPSATWTYRDENGRELFHVLRFDAPDGSKKILPLAFCARTVNASGDGNCTHRRAHCTA